MDDGRGRLLAKESCAGESSAAKGKGLICIGDKPGSGLNRRLPGRPQAGP